MRDTGELIELSRGVFRQAEAPTPNLPDLLAVAHRVPTGIVCCVSALVVYDLTDEIPSTVQIAIPRRQRPPRIDHPPTEVFRFAGATFELGLSSVEAAPARTSGCTAPNEPSWICYATDWENHSPSAPYDVTCDVGMLDQASCSPSPAPWTW